MITIIQISSKMYVFHYWMKYGIHPLSVTTSPSLLSLSRSLRPLRALFRSLLASRRSLSLSLSPFFFFLAARLFKLITSNYMVLHVLSSHVIIYHLSSWTR